MACPVRDSQSGRFRIRPPGRRTPIETDSRAGSRTGLAVRSASPAVNLASSIERGFERLIESQARQVGERRLKGRAVNAKARKAPLFRTTAGQIRQQQASDSVPLRAGAFPFRQEDCRARTASETRRPRRSPGRPDTPCGRRKIRRKSARWRLRMGQEQRASGIRRVPEHQPGQEGHDRYI